ncbi:MAG: imidazolonepropionase [Myxococcales bacterium]|jgi:imidazolonepropionase|nr:imidazolonepropionase [Myxococcales bacterium]
MSRSSRPNADLIIHNAAQVWSFGTRVAGSGLPDVIEAGALAVADGAVIWVGPESALATEICAAPDAVWLDAAQGLVTPGFIDCHTHLVFAGTRAEEIAARCAGESYLSISAKGGGINATVRATRATSEDALVELALPRLSRLLGFGVTMAEVKSGYGLSTESELKMLRAIQRLGARQPIETIATLMCAHAIPPEFSSARERYLDLCVSEIVPEAARLGFVRFCDAFVEQGAFEVEEARRVLERAAALGMRPRLHAEQMTSRGAIDLALDLGAATVDHLEALQPTDIPRLAASDVTSVLLPLSTLFLDDPRRAPGRALWDAGARVALATNLNPGTAMSENAALALGLAARFNGLRAEEALEAFTLGAARALGLEDRVGALCPGFQADLVVHAAPSLAHLVWHLGISHVRQVVKRGRLVLDRRDVPRCS